MSFTVVMGQIQGFALGFRASSRSVGRMGNTGCLVFFSQRVCPWLRKLPPSCINVLWLFPSSAWRRTQDTKMRSTAYLPISLSLVERLVLIWLFIVTYVQFLLFLSVEKKRILGLETSFGGCWFLCLGGLTVRFPDFSSFSLFSHNNEMFIEK